MYDQYDDFKKTIENDNKNIFRNYYLEEFSHIKNKKKHKLNVKEKYQELHLKVPLKSI